MLMPTTVQAHSIWRTRRAGKSQRLGRSWSAQPAVAKHIRRLACLLTTIVGDTLRSEGLWAYQRPQALTR